MTRKGTPLDQLHRLIDQHREPSDRGTVNARLRVAIATGLSYDSINHWLSGRREIGPLAAECIHDALYQRALEKIHAR